MGQQAELAHLFRALKAPAAATGWSTFQPARAVHFSTGLDSCRRNHKNRAACVPDPSLARAAQLDPRCVPPSMRAGEGRGHRPVRAPDAVRSNSGRRTCRERPLRKRAQASSRRRQRILVDPVGERQEEQQLGVGSVPGRRRRGSTARIRSCRRRWWSATKPLRTNSQRPTPRGSLAGLRELTALTFDLRAPAPGWRRWRTRERTPRRAAPTRSSARAR